MKNWVNFFFVPAERVRSLQAVSCLMYDDRQSEQSSWRKQLRSGPVLLPTGVLG